MVTRTAAIRHDRDVVRVTGSDAADYLQGQISQDVEGLEVGDSAWSLVLAPTGKVDSWLRLHRLAPDEFVCDLDPGHAGSAIARLARFKLRSDVAFEAEPGWSIISVRGPAAGEVAVPAELTAEVCWPGFEGFDHLGRQVELPAGLARFTESEYEALRISVGWPRLGAELTPETIPAEAGGALIGASVSFTKGCYTGQELVARIDSRGGNVPHPIRLLVGPVDRDLPVGAAVELDGAEIGTVTSSAGRREGEPGLALARVPRRVEPGATVTVGGLVATVQSLPA